MWLCHAARQRSPRCSRRHRPRTGRRRSNGSRPEARRRVRGLLQWRGGLAVYDRRRPGWERDDVQRHVIGSADSHIDDAAVYADREQGRGAATVSVPWRVTESDDAACCRYRWWSGRSCGSVPPLSFVLERKFGNSEWEYMGRGAQTGSIEWLPNIRLRLSC